MKIKAVECRSKEQRRAFSEVPFDLAMAIWMKWFCKIPFPNWTYFKLEVLIAECVTLKSHKKNLSNVPARNREEHFQDYLSNLLWHYNCNGSSKYNFKITFFWIESFDDGVWYFGEPWKKKSAALARNGEEHFQSYLSNGLWLYDCTDSAKNNFQIHFISNWTFW